MRRYTTMGRFFAVFVLLLVGSVAVPGELLAPRFSHEAGFHKKPFQLRLTHPDPAVQIYYTLDGSVPDPTNLGGRTYRFKNSYEQPPDRPSDRFLHHEYRTYRYDKPIFIRNRTHDPDRLAWISTTFDTAPRYFPQPHLVPKETLRNRLIGLANRFINRWNHLGRIANHWWYRLKTGEDKPLANTQYLVPLEPRDFQLEYTFKGTPVRAVAVSSDNQQSAIESRTYFVSDSSALSLPVIALTIPEKELFSYENGIFVAGRSYDRWLLRQNGSEIGKDHTWPANWRNKERRPDAVLEYFSGINEADSAVGSEEVQLKLHGRASRRFPIKSIRIYPGKTPIDLHGVLFSENKDSFKQRLILRNGGSVYGQSNLNDVVAHEVTKGLSFGVQAYRPVLTFINGEFWGLMNLRERKDSRYVAGSYGLLDRKIDLIQRRSDIKRGSIEGWIRFLEDLTHSDPSAEEFYSFVSNKIDVESFLDYHIASIYIASLDWPGNNIAWWRYRGKKRGSDVLDGRWRWLLYDRDHSFRLPNHETLDMATSEVKTESQNYPWSTFVLRTLLKNERFRNEFVRRFSDLMNTTFVPHRVVEIIQQLTREIQGELPRHIARWGVPETLEDWSKSVDDMLEFVEMRPAVQRQHLIRHFGLEGLYTLSVDVNESDRGTVKVNTIHLGLRGSEVPSPAAANARAVLMEDVLSFPWRGEYFLDLPLRLEAVARPGYQFRHWEVTDSWADTQPRSIFQDVLKLSPSGDLSITAVFERRS